MKKNTIYVKKVKFIDLERGRGDSRTSKIKLLNIEVFTEGSTFSLKGI